MTTLPQQTPPPQMQSLQEPQTSLLQTLQRHHRRRCSRCHSRRHHCKRSLSQRHRGRHCCKHHRGATAADAVVAKGADIVANAVIVAAPPWTLSSQTSQRRHRRRCSHCQSCRHRHTHSHRCSANVNIVVVNKMQRLPQQTPPPQMQSLP